MYMVPNGRIRAVVQHRLGDWRDARVEVIPTPQPGPDAVLIATEAASLNFADLLMLEGKYQHKAPLPYIPGRDAAGTIIAVGTGVTGFRCGDRVIATLNYGAFAEVTLAAASACQKLPAGVSFETAAACGTGIPTIVAAMALRGRLQAGERVLISGAAGGMGSLAVSYARAIGARAIALVSSPDKERAVRELGAELVLRTDEIPDLKAGLRAALQAHTPEGVDAAIDMVGGETFEAMLRCLRPEGRLVVVGFASGQIPNVAANYLLLKDVAVIGSSITRLLNDGSEAFVKLCTEAYGMLDSGRLHVPIDSRYSFDEFIVAGERLAARKAVGKVILRP